MDIMKKEILLCKAVQRLDKRLQQMHVAPFELNVCGGFALLLQEVRKNGGIYTDIDYIGADFPPDVKLAVKEIGNELGFGSNWINNDVLLAGTTLDDLEYATGKLHFECKMNLPIIKVNALNKKDLLRMKVIAIDTSLCGLQFGGTFSRMKDFEDVRLLAKDLNMTQLDIENECELYVEQPEVFDLIRYYCKTGDRLLCVNQSYDEIIAKADSILEEGYEDTKGDEEYAIRR